MPGITFRLSFVVRSSFGLSLEKLICFRKSVPILPIWPTASRETIEHVAQVATQVFVPMTSYIN